MSPLDMFCSIAGWFSIRDQGKYCLIVLKQRNVFNIPFLSSQESYPIHGIICKFLMPAQIQLHSRTFMLSFYACSSITPPLTINKHGKIFMQHKRRITTCFHFYCTPAFEYYSKFGCTQQIPIDSMQLSLILFTWICYFRAKPIHLRRNFWSSYFGYKQ